MKIKTITCHNVNNFGASLQAYALMKYLDNLGHEVEIINYNPEYLKYNLFAIGPKWKNNFILKMLYFAYVIPKRLIQYPRRKKFSAFINKELKLTKKSYSSNDELKKDLPIADVYFAGSDQIWNTFKNNGKDPAFYLDFVPDNIVKASYAASFSTPTIENNFVDFVRQKLNRFDFISVREKTGLNILNSLGFEGQVVLDPVFLIDNIQWIKLASRTKIKEENYIFIYDQENNRNIKNTAIDLSRKLNLKIYAIEALYPFTYANKRIRNAGPIEFLNLILNCKVCLTNSFHCTAFSIIFNKDFYLFERLHESVNSRMIDLLESIKLTHRIITDKKRIEEIEPIDYKKINAILIKNKESSIKYIDKVLKYAYKKKG